jgi:hypothetical protein
MMTGAIRRVLGFSTFFGAIACSLLVDTDAIEDGCPAGMKVCPGTGECVVTNDPKFGCADPRCEPCIKDRTGKAFGARYVPTCNAGACDIGACLYGYGCEDCDQPILTSEDHCGGCNQACDAGTCSMGVCVTEAAGFDAGVTDSGAGGAGGAAN